MQAQTTDDLFNESVVQTLEITIHSRDWETLRANFTSNDFYPADVTWNGLRVRNVGIRSRGLGSRSGVKPGLEVNFAHYSSRGQFLGLRALVLDNLTTDPSMIRERVAMAFLRRIGVPAPREVHAQLYVNGQYSGLYVIVEPDRHRRSCSATLGENSGCAVRVSLADSRTSRRSSARTSISIEPFFEPRTQETQLDLRSVRSDSRAVPHHQLGAGRLVSRCGQRAARPRVHAAADRRRERSWPSGTASSATRA